MLVVLILATVVSTAPPKATEAARGAWTGAALGEPHRGHTATPLGGGRVLLVGGGPCDDRNRPGGGKTAETFDASSMQSQRLPDLAVPRREHSTSVMKGGRIVVVGGVANVIEPVGATAAVELLALGRANDAGGAAAAWARGPDLRQARRAHAAVVLPDGRLLVVGGYDDYGNPLSSTEIWDGSADRWREGPALATARGTVRAHVLRDGRVLVLGAAGETEIWKASAGRWRRMKAAAFAPLPTSPATLSSVSLPDGSIVAIGRRDDPRQNLTVYPVEIWNPRTETWTERSAERDRIGAAGTATVRAGEIVYVDGERAAALSTATFRWRELEPPLSSLRGQSQTVLPDGRILVAGGQGWRCDRAEILDPNERAPGRWTPGLERGDVLAAIGDGRLLVQTGPRESQTWDPAAGQFGPAARMSVERRGFTATALSDGRTLVAGGTDPTKEPPQIVTRKKRPERMSPDLLGTVELYAPQANAWSAGQPLGVPRDGHRAALLPGGDVLVLGGYTLLYGPEPDVGGFSYHVSSGCLDSVERWSHDDGRWRPGARTLALPCDKQVAVLSDGRVLLAGGAARSAEVYDPARDAWSATGPLLQAREGHALAALPDGRALAIGGHPPSAGVRSEPALASAEVWAAASGTWIAVAPLNVPRTDAHALLLRDGRVFVTGATRDGGATVPEVWDAAANRWTVVAALSGRTDSTCLPWLLKDGCVSLCNKIWCPQ